MSSCEQHQLACNYILYLIKFHLHKIYIMDLNVYKVTKSQLQEITRMVHYSHLHDCCHMSLIVLSQPFTTSDGCLLSLYTIQVYI